MEDLDANPNILPRVLALTIRLPTSIAWTWRWSSLLITAHVSDSPLSFSSMSLIIACVCVCLQWLEKGPYRHPCPQAQWGSAQHAPIPWMVRNKYLLNGCLHSVTQKGSSPPLRSLLLLTHISHTATLRGRDCPYTRFTNEGAWRGSKLLKVTWLEVGGGATDVKCVCLVT